MLALEFENPNTNRGPSPNEEPCVRRRRWLPARLAARSRSAPVHRHSLASLAVAAETEACSVTTRACLALAADMLDPLYRDFTLYHVGRPVLSPFHSKARVFHRPPPEGSDTMDIPQHPLGKAGFLNVALSDLLFFFQWGGLFE